MKLIAYVLLALLHHCAAHPLDPGQSEQPEQSLHPRQPGHLVKPQFALDPSCKNLKDGAGNHIVTQIQDAIDVAANAVKVLSDKINNNHVVEMCRLVLGDADFAIRVQQIKAVFENVAAFDRTPSPLSPTSPEWLARGSNKDVAFFCDEKRFTEMDNDEIEIRQTECYLELDIAKKREEEMAERSDLQLTEAMTMRSDIRDRAQFAHDEQADPQNFNKWDPKYYTETTDANTIDICTWFWQYQQQLYWPRLDADLIREVQEPGFITQLGPGLSQIDALSGLWTTILHEFTHTNQGGVLHDVNVRAMNIPDVDDCYTWRCVTRIHRVDNADSVAMLGMALQLFTLGYYVNAAGEVRSI